LAEAHKTAFIGTDIMGKSDPELSLADTIIQKKSYFPKSKKKGRPKGKININTASKAQLKALPGVGEVTAKKIIAYREKNRFSSIEEIKRVKGIGPKKYKKMEQYLSK
jgi:competence protein ComEA